MKVPHVVVVGGGISGLAAAWELAGPAARTPVRVSLLDAADAPGGKLRAVQVAGVRVDVGAESMLARRPEAVELAGEVGLADRVVHPQTGVASIWSRGALWPLPRGTVMGVPAQPADAAGLLAPLEVRRARRERAQPAVRADDVSVGELVAGRMGRAVLDRLVEPLLGGVYAGQARGLSVRATVPALWPAARDGTPIGEVARQAQEPAGPGGPVFAGLVGGISALAEQLTDRLRERGVWLGVATIVRELHQVPGGWWLVTGAVPAASAMYADAVVLATPAAPTARLLREPAPMASASLAGIDYASTALLTLALPEGSLDEATGSGLLVPPVDGHAIKAATFSANKWQWVRAAGAANGVVLVRASLGRHGETAVLQRPDEELVDTVRAELSEALGLPVPRPVDAHVQRWGGALPQYAVGHLARVQSIYSDLARLPGLEVAGAAYAGVGIPACIASGRTAARAVMQWLGSAQASHERGGESGV